MFIQKCKHRCKYLPICGISSKLNPQPPRFYESQSLCLLTYIVTAFWKTERLIFSRWRGLRPQVMAHANQLQFAFLERHLPFFKKDRGISNSVLPSVSIARNLKGQREQSLSSEWGTGFYIQSIVERFSTTVRKILSPPTSPQKNPGSKIKAWEALWESNSSQLIRIKVEKI